MTAPARRSVAERIATTLRASIVKGKLQPGDALPSERELAEKYAVNRSSVREAMKRLEAWGLVKIRHGGATRVADLLDAGFHLVPSLVEAGGEVGQAVLRDIHEIRGMMLGWGAEQAAKKADPASLARLDELARSLGEARAKPERLQELDYDFFEELMLISGNQLLTLLARVVRDVYFKGAERFVAMYRPDVFDAAHHRRAVAAMRARDAQAAGDAMRAHASSALRLLETAR
ncbi:MAG: FadR/GntR family transcriptional regulator [Myxococcota bacterium]